MLNSVRPVSDAFNWWSLMISERKKKRGGKKEKKRKKKKRLTKGAVAGQDTPAAAVSPEKLMFMVFLLYSSPLPTSPQIFIPEESEALISTLLVSCCCSWPVMLSPVIEAPRASEGLNSWVLFSTQPPLYSSKSTSSLKSGSTTTGGNSILSLLVCWQICS